jgi:RNA polymerase sigma factor for flagellar operon FliA
MTREQQFLAELASIERLISWVCVRRGLRGADAEDFASIVKLRLIQNDYEVFAKFEGRSSMKTYLATVINHVYLDFQVERFGKFRPSAQAKRLGRTAIRLEQLTHRDGLSFDEACNVLLNDPKLGETRDSLHAIWLRLPRRPVKGPREIRGEPETFDGGSHAIERAERQALAEKAFAVIRCVLSKQPARDRVFLRLIFQSGFTVADAARSLGLDDKKSYRKREAVLELLRTELEREGIGREEAAELLETLDWDAALDLQEPEADTEPVRPESVQEPEQSGSRPSQERDEAARRDDER